MNEQNIPQPNEPVQSSKHIWIIIIAVVLTAIIVGGGVYAWQKSNLQSTEQSLQQQISELQNQITNLQESTPPAVTGQENTQESTESNETNTNETVTSKPGWTTATNQQLGIRFEYPADASISSVSQRETSDGTTINEMTVTPTGMDPTTVHFFTTSASLDQAKNIQIYGFTNVKNSEFVNTTIDGRAGTRRIDHYLNNDCTNELSITEKNGVVYGFHVVQCPTHPQGYDQLRKDIADSLELLK